MTDHAFLFGTRRRRGRDDTIRLLPLFRDPDARGTRKWRDMFDRDACEEIDADEITRSLPTGL